MSRMVPERLPADSPGLASAETAQYCSTASRGLPWLSDPDFGQRLLYEGSRVLSGFALSPEAKAAIVSGDVVWLEKECGELTRAERDWLERRLQAEIW